MWGHFLIFFWISLSSWNKNPNWLITKISCNIPYLWCMAWPDLRAFVRPFLTCPLAALKRSGSMTGVTKWKKCVSISLPMKHCMYQSTNETLYVSVYRYGCHSYLSSLVPMCLYRAVEGHMPWGRDLHQVTEKQKKEDVGGEIDEGKR